mmetsp:Transcript_1571/g.5400  ORF Transcript_1571/g.5400 Transcript_1571/m.5400 type:complete len:214 (+) Transcript_1571:937-1578(+)
MLSASVFSDVNSSRTCSKLPSAPARFDSESANKSDCSESCSLNVFSVFSSVSIFSFLSLKSNSRSSNRSGDRNTPFFARVAARSFFKTETSFCRSFTRPVFVTLRLTSGRHRTLRAREAYSTVAVVSSAELKLGPTVATIMVLLFPPSASLNSRVSFESRYGTCASLSTKAVMTRPRVNKLLLISPASRDRAVAPFSATPDLPTFSDPARSTK